jgi:hypothetical protein
VTSRRRPPLAQEIEHRVAPGVKLRADERYVFPVDGDGIPEWQLPAGVEPHSAKALRFARAYRDQIIALLGMKPESHTDPDDRYVFTTGEFVRDLRLERRKRSNPPRWFALSERRP